MKARDLIHEFVRDFLPCPPCRSHFLEQWDACANGACDVDDAAGLQVCGWIAILNYII